VGGRRGGRWGARGGRGVRRGVGTAGSAGDGFDSLPLEQAGDQFCASDLHRTSSSSAFHRRAARRRSAQKENPRRPAPVGGSFVRFVVPATASGPPVRAALRLTTRSSWGRRVLACE